MAADRPVVLGVDIGTTSTKVAAVDLDGQVLAVSSAGYPLAEPRPGHAVQDPERVTGAALAAVAQAVADVGADRVTGVSVSAPLHSLLGLDSRGRPLTPLMTWADNRATEQAARVRASAGGLALHRRTGTPIHPMSPLTKLMWWRDNEPELTGRVAHWVGIKAYVLNRLCGVLVTDHSVASSTGLLDLSRLQWDTEAMQLADVRPEQLGQLVPTTTVLEGLTTEGVEATGLPATTRVVVGATDGPLANLGVGAVHPGVAGCTIGTSGALRVMVDRPAVDPEGRVFCYALTESRWVVGGAVNNGGVVLDWAGDALAPDLGEHPAEELLRLAAAVPAGSGGLVMLPHLLGERAPHWSPLMSGAYVGLTRAHRRGHLVRAALEGASLQIALVLQSMREAGIPVHEVRATGGFARSELWRQLLADVLGMPVHFPASPEGSSFGAALLGMQALGLVATIEDAAELVSISSVAVPDPRTTATYASLLPVFADLHDALGPTFASLRRLAPGLPLSGHQT